MKSYGRPVRNFSQAIIYCIIIVSELDQLIRWFVVWLELFSSEVWLNRKWKEITFLLNSMYSLNCCFLFVLDVRAPTPPDISTQSEAIESSPMIERIPHSSVEKVVNARLDSSSGM